LFSTEGVQRRQMVLMGSLMYGAGGRWAYAAVGVRGGRWG
jgi:hypothetical protein